MQVTSNVSAFSSRMVSTTTIDPALSNHVSDSSSICKHVLANTAFYVLAGGAQAIVSFPIMQGLGLDAPGSMNMFSLVQSGFVGGLCTLPISLVFGCFDSDNIFAACKSEQYWHVAMTINYAFAALTGSYIAMQGTTICSGLARDRNIAYPVVAGATGGVIFEGIVETVKAGGALLAQYNTSGRQRVQPAMDDSVYSLPAGRKLKL